MQLKGSEDEQVQIEWILQHWPCLHPLEKVPLEVMVRRVLHKVLPIGSHGDLGPRLYPHRSKVVVSRR